MKSYVSKLVSTVNAWLFRSSHYNITLLPEATICENKLG